NIRGYAPLSLGPKLRTQPPGDVGQTLGSLPLGGNMQVIWNSEVEFPLVPKRATRPRGVGGETLGSLPLGGNMQVIWNSEVEFPLFKKVGISGVLFYDMGNAYNLEDRYCSGLQRKHSQVSIKFDPCFRAAESLTVGLRKSVGFGFRWISPIGPLRFEW